MSARDDVLNQLVAKGVVTNKKLFCDMLEQNKMEITKIMVDAIGYDGKSVVVPIDTPYMFTCCSCSEYCTSEYGGCDVCGHPTCANCARGDAQHLCSQKQ